MGALDDMTENAKEASDEYLEEQKQKLEEQKEGNDKKDSNSD